MITLINGNVQTPGGLIVPQGSISFQLNVDGTVIAAPYGIVLAEEVVTFQFDGTGNLQANSKIYSNAELEPQNSNGLGTYYLVTFYDANGARINKNPMWWQFPEAANSTVDISRMTPYAVIGGNIIFYPIPSAGGGGGTVTSVAFAGDGTVLSATPTAPVITAGVLSATLLSQNANTFLAGPTTGAAADPTFRLLVATDIPNLDASKITSGFLPIALGGTGTASPTLTAGNDIAITGSWPNNTVSVKAQSGVTPGSYTNSNLTVDAQGIITAVANGSSGFVNPMTTLGDTLYENATPAAARLAGNTTATKQFLTQTGTGVISAAPVWAIIVAGDIPNLPASIITSGELALARGGTNADLSVTGGTSQVLKQVSSGAAITVAQLAASDLSNGVTGSGAVVLAVSGALTGTPTAPTATTVGSPTNTTQVATTAFATKVGVPRPNFRRWAYIVADGTTSLPNNLGTGDKIVSFTSNGALSGSTPTASAPSNFNISTGAASSATAHFNGSANYRTGKNIRVQAYMQMADTYSTVRSWSGMMNTNPSGLITPIFPIAAFRALAGTDTNFQCYTSDSVSSTITDSGVTADNGWHRFEIMFNDSVPNVQFYIDGVLVATNTTHLPNASTDLFFATTIDLPTGSASRTQSIGWIYVETDS